MQQTTLDNALDWLVNNPAFLNQHIAFPNGTYQGECTAPVAQLLAHLNIPLVSMANDRADGWGVSFPSIYSPYFIHEPYEAGTIYPRGTIMMWSSPHIAIVMSNNGSNVGTFFEQNADPNGSTCGTHTRTIDEPGYHTATWVLIWKIEVPPAPTPAPPKPTCTYQRITPVTMLTNKNPTTWWNLGWTDINDAQAMAHLNEGTQFPAVGQAHHESGNNYYMTAADFGDADVSGQPVNNNGVNILDLSLMPPPSPAPTLATAAPATQAPDTTPYPVVTTLKSYSSAPNALTRTGTVVMLAPSSPTNVYYRFNTLNGMDSLTKTLGQNSQWWINPADNVLPAPVKSAIEPWPVATPPAPAVAEPVVPPTPKVITTPGTAWKATYKAFNAENLPIKYTLLYDVDAVEYSGVRPDALLNKGQDVWIFGTFTSPKGVVCGRLRSDKDETFQYYFGIPMVDMRMKSKLLTIVDYVDLGFQRVMDIVRKKI